MKPLTTVAWLLFLAAAVLALIFGIEFERGNVYYTTLGWLAIAASSCALAGAWC